MNNDTPKNDRPTVAPADLPVQRKILAGPSAVSILPEAGNTGNRRGPEPIGVALARVYKLILAQQGQP